MYAIFYLILQSYSPATHSPEFTDLKYELSFYISPFSCFARSGFGFRKKFRIQNTASMDDSRDCIYLPAIYFLHVNV